MKPIQTAITAILLLIVIRLLLTWVVVPIVMIGVLLSFMFTNTY